MFYCCRNYKLYGRLYNVTENEPLLLFDQSSFHTTDWAVCRCATSWMFQHAESWSFLTEMCTLKLCMIAQFKVNLNYSILY